MWKYLWKKTIKFNDNFKSFWVVVSGDCQNIKLSEKSFSIFYFSWSILKEISHPSLSSSTVSRQCSSPEPIDLILKIITVEKSKEERCIYLPTSKCYAFIERWNRTRLISWWRLRILFHTILNQTIYVFSSSCLHFSSFSLILLWCAMSRIIERGTNNSSHFIRRSSISHTFYSRKKSSKQK